MAPRRHASVVAAGSRPGAHVYYSDLEFHIKRRLPIEDVLAVLASSGDIYAITGRGANWTESFEHTYDSFSADAQRVRSWALLWSNALSLALERRADGRRLFLLRAQEILTAENCDVVVLGSQRSFDDGVRSSDLARAVRSDGGVSILAHPYFPMMGLLGTSEGAVKRVAETVDAIETFNQQAAVGGASYVHRSKALAASLGKIGIAASDMHLYRLPRHRVLDHSGLWVTFLPRSGHEFFPAFKEALLASAFVPRECTSLHQILAGTGLSLREATYLYRFAFKSVGAPRLGADRVACDVDAEDVCTPP